MPSSASTFSAARATAQASGLPPKVLPCCPGCSTPSTSRVREHGRHRIEAARQRLADQRHVGLDALVLLGQQLAGAAEPRLDLVQDQRHVCWRAELPHPRKYPAGGIITPASPWIGSTRKATVFGVIAASKRSASPNGTHPEAGRERPEAAARIADRSRSRRSPMVRPWKLSDADDDLRLPLRHALDLVAPFADRLDGRLHRLGAAVHRQDLVRIGQRRDLLVEQRATGRCGTRATSASACRACSTIAARMLRMAMALVDGRIGRQAVQIAAAARRPRPRRLSPRVSTTSSGL